MKFLSVLIVLVLIGTATCFSWPWQKRHVRIDGRLTCGKKVLPKAKFQPIEVRAFDHDSCKLYIKLNSVKKYLINYIYTTTLICF